jgi:hypothetical protein
MDFENITGFIACDYGCKWRVEGEIQRKKQTH